MCPPTLCLVTLALRYLRDSLLRLGAQYIVPFRPRLSWSATSRRAGASHAAAACGFLGLTRQGPPTDPVRGLEMPAWVLPQAVLNMRKLVESSPLCKLT